MVYCIIDTVVSKTWTIFMKCDSTDILHFAKKQKTCLLKDILKYCQINSWHGVKSSFVEIVLLVITTVRLSQVPASQALCCLSVLYNPKLILFGGINGQNKKFKHNPGRIFYNYFIDQLIKQKNKHTEWLVSALRETNPETMGNINNGSSSRWKWILFNKSASYLHTGTL